jgi:hypothetical protein
MLILSGSTPLHVAAELLRGLRARDTAAKTLRALARDLISGVRQLDCRIAKAANDIQNSPDWGARDA